VTPADTFDPTVCILIDAWTDGYVEQFAWVKVTSQSDTTEKAIAKLQSEFPVEEQGEGGEGQRYELVERCWERPIGMPDGDGIVRAPDDEELTWHWPEVPWEECKPDDENAQEFWKFEVVEDA
jgi:hypothetical protein